jgi:hypothetical protein
MQLTTPHLQEISFQVCRGNAAYGLLLANEYLAPHHPLRRALVGKAKPRLAAENSLPEPLLHAIFGGVTAAALQGDWRTLVGPKAVRLEKKETPVPCASVTPFATRLEGRRTAIRERTQQRRTTARLCAVHAAQVTSRRCVSVG